MSQEDADKQEGRDAKEDFDGVSVPDAIGKDNDDSGLDVQADLDIVDVPVIGQAAQEAAQTGLRRVRRYG